MYEQIQDSTDRVIWMKISSPLDLLGNGVKVKMLEMPPQLY